jgi:hypothetical protein
MKTSQKQISLFTEDQLTSLPVDSHANHIQAQENDLGKRTSDISGRICSEQFKKLSQPSSWGKMFVDLLIGTGEWSSKKCALTWKVVGTKYNRYYCQLVPLVRHTEEIEYGSLLPTPTVFDSTNASATMQSSQVKEGSMHSMTLTRMMDKGMLPTPRTSDKNMHWKTENWKGDDLGSHINEIYGTRFHLNPRFVAEMMGFPPNWTELPFLNGDKNQ